MALRFADEGARVAALGRSEDALQAVADDASGDVLAVTADVRDSEAVADAVAATVDAFGGLDTVVNNAGVSVLSLAGKQQPLVEYTDDEWATVLETNLTGVFHVCRAAAPYLVEGGGNVLNVSSGFGRRAGPGVAAYAASKWGVEGLTRTLAAELRDDGVNVNAIDPGGRVDTAFWSHRDDVEKRDPTVMNDAAVLLASQGPSGTTGESMTAAEWEDVLGDG